MIADASPRVRTPESSGRRAEFPETSIQNMMGPMANELPNGNGAGADQAPSLNALIQYTKDFEENERARAAAREAERKRKADEEAAKRKQQDALEVIPAPTAPKPEGE